MKPNMTANITCINVEHYILLLTILNELSEGKDGWGEGREWKGTDEYLREAFSRIFSQWDVETDVSILIHCVCVLSISEVQSVWGSVIYSVQLL